MYTQTQMHSYTYTHAQRAGLLGVYGAHTHYSNSQIAHTLVHSHGARKEERHHTCATSAHRNTLFSFTSSQRMFTLVEAKCFLYVCVPSNSYKRQKVHIRFTGDEGQGKENERQGDIGGCRW